MELKDSEATGTLGDGDSRAIGTIGRGFWGDDRDSGATGILGR